MRTGPPPRRAQPGATGGPGTAWPRVTPPARPSATSSSPGGGGLLCALAGSRVLRLPPPDKALHHLLEEEREPAGHSRGDAARLARRPPANPISLVCAGLRSPPPAWCRPRAPAGNPAHEATASCSHALVPPQDGRTPTAHTPPNQFHAFIPQTSSAAHVLPVLCVSVLPTPGTGVGTWLVPRDLAH